MLQKPVALEDEGTQSKAKTFENCGGLHLEVEHCTGPRGQMISEMEREQSQCLAKGEFHNETDNPLWESVHHASNRRH
jgi:hypothetical protein